MRRITMAFLAIAAGLILLFRNLNLFPDVYFRIYLDWAERYWPVALVLLGIQVLVKDRYYEFSRILKGLILLALLLWLVCRFTVDRKQVFY